MRQSRTRLRRLITVVAATLSTVLATGVAAAHEQRDVAGYSFVVGFIDEPIFVGQKGGLEFFVTQGDTPVEGLESTLKAEAIYQDQKRDLPLEARFGEAGAYESVFFPTAPGAYTFHIFGTVGDQAIDESFTSSPDGFSEVEALSGGQFPVQFPAQADIVADAQAGKTAASQVPIALVLGAAGLVVGLVAVGLLLAGRRRST